MNITKTLNEKIPITLDESGWEYNGPFSTYKEIHSAVLGFGAGLTDSPELQSAVTAYAIGRGATKHRDDEGERADAHWRQVAEEPAYALGAMSVGHMIKRGDAVASVLPTLL